jgi:hypothetical protein
VCLEGVLHWGYVALGKVVLNEMGIKIWCRLRQCRVAMRERRHTTVEKPRLRNLILSTVAADVEVVLVGLFCSSFLDGNLTPVSKFPAG